MTQLWEKMTHILLLWTLTIQSYFMSAAQAQSLKLDKATKCHLFLNSDSHDMEPFGDPLILNVSIKIYHLREVPVSGGSFSVDMR